MLPGAARLRRCPAACENSGTGIGTPQAKSQALVAATSGVELNSLPGTQCPFDKTILISFRRDFYLQAVCHLTVNVSSARSERCMHV